MRRARYARWAVLPILLFCGAASAQDTADADAPVPPPVSVRLKMDVFDRFTIPTHVEGKGPYPFLVDTGSQTTIISHELAQSLELKPDIAMRIVSMSGAADVDTVSINRLSYGHGDVQALRVPVLAQANLGAMGLLGLDSLQQRKLVINNRAGTMQISDSKTRSTGDAIIVQARSRFGQLVLVDSTVEGRKVSVILDTGAQHSVGNIALYTALWKREKLAKAVPVTMTSVLGKNLVGHWSVIEKMRVGGVTMNHVSVIFTDATPFRTLGLENTPALLLGMDVLSGFTRIEVDFRRRLVSFYLPGQGFEAASLQGLIRN